MTWLLDVAEEKVIGLISMFRRELEKVENNISFKLMFKEFVYKLIIMLFDFLAYFFLSAFKIIENLKSIFLFYSTDHSKTIELTVMQNERENYEDKYKVKLASLDESDEKHTPLMNSIVMDYTPVGNVLLFYNAERETFDYYSNNTVPYRFLETVARKFVINNNCRHLYVSDYDKDTNNNAVADEDIVVKDEEEEPKASVFAKFKSYNRGSIKTAGAPRNNSVSKPENMVKKRTNRYSYKGKISNYDFLKKVDKSVCNKALAMTYAEFRKNLSRYK